MDVLYHGVVGYAIGKTLGGQLEGVGAIAAMLPDFIGGAPFYYFKLIGVSRTSFKTFSRDICGMLNSNEFDNGIDRTVYHTTHSLFTAVLISLLAYLFFHPVWLVVSISYLSHILIDIPTHDGDFATHIFYPFSDFHWERKNWAKHPGIFMTFWGALIALIVLLNFIQ